MGSVYSVGQVSSYIRNMFEQDYLLKRISIRGEISNCKYHTSGHIYFTLKDESASMAAVMFAGNRKNLNFTLKNGQKVVVEGQITVYERDGKYQLYARDIRLDGMGELYRQYLLLKEELEAGKQTLEVTYNTLKMLNIYVIGTYPQTLKAIRLVFLLLRILLLREL